MKIKTILLISIVSILFLGILPASAAVSIPTIAGIPKDATAAEFIVYFFNLMVAVGGLIAVVIVIMAGIEWMTSDGNPSKIESAKDKIKNTLLGVAVLMGCYVILNIINPTLTTVKINKLYCYQGIAVNEKPSADSTENDKQVCITDTTSKLGYYIDSTLDWNFQADTLLAVYTYSGENFTGTRTEFSCENGGCSGRFGDIPNTTQSVFFLWKNPGLYLYDQPDYKLGVKAHPLFLSSSNPNLATQDFDNFTSSIRIMDPKPEEKTAYQAIVFTAPNYTGNCSFLAQSAPSMENAMGGYYPTPIKNNTLSSLIITKTSLDQTIVSDRGTITLYTKPNCAEPTASSGAEVKTCNITSDGQQNVYTYCTSFNSGDAVRSFKITGPLGLVLSTGTGPADECRYYDINSIGNGVCYADLEADGLYDPAGVKPMFFVRVTVDKR